MSKAKHFEGHDSLRRGRIFLLGTILRIFAVVQLVHEAGGQGVDCSE